MTNTELIGILMDLFSQYFTYMLPVYGVIAGVTLVVSMFTYALWLPSSSFRGMK